MNTSQGDALAVDPPVVIPARQEVTFADGSALWLHRDDAAPTMFERRLQLDDGRWTRIDLRRLVPSLGFSLAGRNMRDDSGAVFHGLRRSYASANALRQFIASGVTR